MSICHSRLLEDLWGHVARCAASRAEYCDFLIVHHPRQPKVGNEQVGRLTLVPE